MGEDALDGIVKNNVTAAALAKNKATKQKTLMDSLKEWSSARPRNGSRLGVSAYKLAVIRILVTWSVALNVLRHCLDRAAVSILILQRLSRKHT